MSNRPRIQTNNQLPGIQNALLYSPKTAAPLNILIETLLRADEGLSRGERELVFAAVSRINGCDFCYGIHSQMAAIQLRSGADIIAAFEKGDPLSSRLTNLIHLARVVAVNDPSHYDTAIQRCLTSEDPLTDREVHDVILVASTAAMVNRYVDALNAPYPSEAGFFRQTAERLIQRGYLSDQQLANK
jgi:alkylhydroperoxidase family enzyme